jgi:hypothetical protein
MGGRESGRLKNPRKKCVGSDFAILDFASWPRWRGDRKLAVGGSVANHGLMDRGLAVPVENTAIGNKKS